MLKLMSKAETLFPYNCAANVQIMSSLSNIKLAYHPPKLNKHNGIHKDWLCIVAQTDINFSWYASVDNELGIHSFSSVDEVYKVPEGDECDIEPVMSFVKSFAVYDTVKSFVYAHSIGWYNERDSLNFKLVVLSEM